MEGAAHVNKDNVAEKWLADDQVSAMNVGGNGPVTRNEVRTTDLIYSPAICISDEISIPKRQGMYNNYAAVKTYWADTLNMDNLRGGTFNLGGSGWDVTTYAKLSGSLDDFPSDLSQLMTVGHAHVQTLNYHDDFAKDIAGTPHDNFALVATGAVTLTAGEHTFCTASDDGSWLYLDGALLVNNGGLC
jgi:hypothetical protein